jgi:hypothetical protein
VHAVEELVDLLGRHLDLVPLVDPVPKGLLGRLLFCHERGIYSGGLGRRVASIWARKALVSARLAAAMLA